MEKKTEIKYILTFDEILKKFGIGKESDNVMIFTNYTNDTIEITFKSDE